MGSADFKLATKQKTMKRQLMEKERKTQSEEEATATCSKVVLISSSSNGGIDCESYKATASVVQEA